MENRMQTCGACGETSNEVWSGDTLEMIEKGINNTPPTFYCQSCFKEKGYWKEYNTINQHYLDYKDPEASGEKSLSKLSEHLPRLELILNDLPNYKQKILSKNQVSDLIKKINLEIKKP